MTDYTKYYFLNYPEVKSSAAIIEMTDIRKALVEEIEQYIEEHDYSCTFDDIIREYHKYIEGCYVSSPSSKVIWKLREELNLCCF